MRTTHCWQHRMRLFLYALVFGTLALSGAEGQTAARDLRIGLKTQQQEVHLQGTVPLRIEIVGVQPFAITADQEIVITSNGQGAVVSDAIGQTLLTAGEPFQIKPDPASLATGSADAAAPLIRLLGPSCHYDGKPDRAYRGYFEILPSSDGLTVVNVVDIESYLWGVVSSEMSPGYPLEALKAQAVAARTYALKNYNRYAILGFDLDDTARCQVYGGYLSEDPRTTRAVNETAGQVLTYNGDLIDAVYSSTCGGFTESAAEAWGKAIPYLVSVPDYIESDAAPVSRPNDEAGWATFFKTSRALNCLQPKYANPEAFRWVRLVTRAEMEANLPEAYRVGTIQELIPLRRGESGRITKLCIIGSDGDVVLDSELTIRKALGGLKALRSSAFTLEAYRDEKGVPVVFAFWGAGWGHGLGMCQVGAVGLAEQGWKYDAILSHYYQGVSISRR